MSLKKQVVLCVLCNILVTFIIVSTDDELTIDLIPKNISCYYKECYDKCDQVLPTFDDNFIPHRKTIYYIEAYCVGGLKSIAACSVESAARANPEWRIVILFAGPLRSEFWQSTTFLKLRSIPNVYFYRLNPTDFVIATPVENIFSDPTILNSLYPSVHSANILRLVTLHRFGGLFLDSDMIAMKSFDSLPHNFIAHPLDTEVGPGIIAVTRKGTGHRFIDMSIRDFAHNFDPKTWTSSTVYIRSLENTCNRNYTTGFFAESCHGGFLVLNHTWFCRWPFWRPYLLVYSGNVVPVYTGTYTDHLWYRHRAQESFLPNSLGAQIAKKYCPKIYNLYGEKFGL